MQNENQADNNVDNTTDAQTQMSARSSAASDFRRNIGSFMTPQPRNQGTMKSSLPGVDSSCLVPGRYSLGGEARRILVQQPWKIHDLIVPPASSPASDSRSLMPVDPPPESLNLAHLTSLHAPTTPAKTPLPASVTPRFPHSVTDEERKAIQERRRSAVRELGSNSFWIGGAPGMSPTKKGVFSSMPSESDSFLPTNEHRPSSSPTKGHLSFHPIFEEDESKVHNSTDEEVDTRGLLEKMKETVNDMKRRRSVIVGGAGNVLSTPHLSIATERELSLEESTDSPVAANVTDGDVRRPNASGLKKPNFTSVGTPAKKPSKLFTLESSPQNDVDDGKTSVESVHGEEPFSLLRPGALEGRRQTLASASLPLEEVRREVGVPVTLPVVILDKAEVDELEEPSYGPHPWSLQAPQSGKEGRADLYINLVSDAADDTTVCFRRQLSFLLTPLPVQ